MGAEEERLWVLQAQQGDQEAFAKIVQAYQKPIYNLAYRMLGDAEEAEDATQEAFLRVYTRLETYDPRYKFSSWVLSIASHYCIDRLRKRRGQTISLEEVNSERWVPDEVPMPEENILHDEREAQVRRLLGALPPHYRLLIVLHYWQDMSYAEIAEITSMTQSAVKSQLHRARRVMAEALARESHAGPSLIPEGVNHHVVPEGH